MSASKRRVRPTHLLHMVCGLMVRRTHPTLAATDFLIDANHYGEM